MTAWQDITTAPKDGTVINTRRVYGGLTVFEGSAIWRTIRFGTLRDPNTGELIAKAYSLTSWMKVDRDFRVPEPTHWKPQQ